MNYYCNVGINKISYVSLQRAITKSALLYSSVYQRPAFYKDFDRKFFRTKDCC